MEELEPSIVDGKTNPREFGIDATDLRFPLREEGFLVLVVQELLTFLTQQFLSKSFLEGTDGTFF